MQQHNMQQLLIKDEHFAARSGCKLIKCFGVTRSALLGIYGDSAAMQLLAGRQFRMHSEFYVCNNAIGLIGYS